MPDGSITPIPFTYLFRILLDDHWEIMALAIFTGVMGISLVLFCGHTLYQIAYGVTTNEVFKWSNVHWRFRNQDQVFEAWQEQLRHTKESSLGENVDDFGFAWLQDKDLINTYNYGLLNNFKEVFFHGSWKNPYPPKK